MKLKKKSDTLFSKKIIDLWGLITVVLALAAFFTGKTDFKSFFQNITLLNFLLTLGKTILSYAITVTVIAFSFLMILDLILVVFGLGFPISHFLWTFIFKTTIIDWWWNSSLPENIFLSALIIYFIANYDIETKNKVISFFYKKVGKKLNGFSLSLFISDMRKDLEGVYIGLIIVRKKKDEIGQGKAEIQTKTTHHKSIAASGAGHQNIG